MKNYMRALSIITILAVSQQAIAESVKQDSAERGKAKAEKVVKKKSRAWGDKNKNWLKYLKGLVTEVEVRVNCADNSDALKNMELYPGNTYVLTGVCDGPVSVSQRAGHYRFVGDADGDKDDGITLPPGETGYFTFGFYGPIHAELDNLIIDASNYSSAADDIWAAPVYVENGATVEISHVDVVGGDGGIFADAAYVYIGDKVSVTDFRQTGIGSGNGGYTFISQPVTVAGANGEPGDYSEALSAYRNGILVVRRGGSFTAGTDDGSNSDFERYSAIATDGGSLRVRNEGDIDLDGYIGAFRLGSIRIQTGTLNGGIWSGDQSHVRVENLQQSGGDIEAWRGSGIRADYSNLSDGTTDPIYIGQMSTMRINGGSIDNASGTGFIETYSYGQVSLRDMADISDRNIVCSDGRSFSPGNGINIGTVDC